MNIANPTIISDSLWTEDCEIYHFQHKPNTKAHLSVSGEYDLFRRTNSHGFLDSEHKYEKPDDTMRIVLLGDSIFESRQVNLNETFYKLMEKSYREVGVNIEFINLGCSGYSPDLEYFRLIDDGFKYNPDIVILGYFFNDVLDVNDEFNNRNKNYYKIANGSIVIDKAKKIDRVRNTEVEQGILPTTKRILSKSKFIRNYLYPFFRRVVNMNGDDATKGNTTTKTPKIPKVFIPLKTDHGKIELEQINESLDLIEHFIKEMDYRCKEKGIKFIVVDVPAGWDLNDGYWEYMKSRYPAMQSETYDLTILHKQIESICERNNVSFIPIPPKCNFETHFQIDSHFNLDGHWYYASYLKQQLDSKYF
jgi:hypothetical protein